MRVPSITQDWLLCTVLAAWSLRAGSQLCLPKRGRSSCLWMLRLIIWRHQPPETGCCVVAHLSGDRSEKKLCAPEPPLVGGNRAEISAGGRAAFANQP